MKKLSLFILLALSVAAVKAQQSAPTWSDDVASIIFNKCSGCHHAGDIAPFSLMSYNDGYMQASAIEDAVSSGLMPPWPPDVNYRRFAHERLLSTNEKTKILAWVAAGAPEGNPANAPTPPVFSATNWDIPNPDLTLKIPDYNSQASSTDIYRCFAIPTNIGVDKYITSVEVIPGNRSAVHHVLVYQDNTGAAITLDDNDPLPGYTNFGGTGVSGATLITGWVPGGGLSSLPSGFGIKLKANSAIVLQVHYPAGSAGQLDSTRINIKFSTGATPREMFMAPALNHMTSMTNGPISIPANSTKKYEEEYTLPANITGFSVAPHMHLIGRSMKVYAISPGTLDTVPLVNIPSWDFHWQGAYTFQYAEKFPTGTKIRAEAFYDNTANNPFNPSNPPQYVHVGEATTDEMMITYFSYALYQPGDENILLDSSLLNPTSAQAQQAKELNVKMHPNPVNHDVYISLPDANDTYSMSIYNSVGQMVLSSQINGSNWHDVSSLTSGVYVVTIRNDKGSFTQKLVKY